MLPEVMIHNSVSLDGSLSGFSADIGLHYKILSSLEPDAMLIGSNTTKTGAGMFADTIPAEELSDTVKPPQARGNSGPYWILLTAVESWRGYCMCSEGQNTARMFRTGL